MSPFLEISPQTCRALLLLHWRLLLSLIPFPRWISVLLGSSLCWSSEYKVKGLASSVAFVNIFYCTFFQKYFSVFQSWYQCINVIFTVVIGWSFQLHVKFPRHVHLGIQHCGWFLKEIIFWDTYIFFFEKQTSGIFRFFFFLCCDVEVILSFWPSLCSDHWPHPALSCSITTWELFGYPWDGETSWVTLSGQISPVLPSWHTVCCGITPTGS